MENYDWEESRNCLFNCEYYDTNNDKCSLDICKKLEIK